MLYSMPRFAGKAPHADITKNLILRRSARACALDRAADLELFHGRHIAAERLAGLAADLRTEVEA